jgi:ApaG protein
MSEAPVELSGLWVSVDQVEYTAGNPAAPDRPHEFAYYITIHNDSSRAITIKGRKWIVTNAGGEKNIIEGDGVVGRFPRLEPGTQFHYNSFHLIQSDSRAEGAYLGQDDSGLRVFAKIPPFELRLPSAGTGETAQS